MGRYIVRRLLWVVVLVFAVVTITFVIFSVLPSGADPARLRAGRSPNPQLIQEIRHRYLLDKPITTQYAIFINKLLPLSLWNNEGEYEGPVVVKKPTLGKQYATGASLDDTIKQAAPVTASLVFGGAVLWMIIGLSVGIFSALRPRSLIDRAAMVFVLIGVSAHPVWIGLIFSYFFGVKWHITPIAGYANFFGAPPDTGLPGGPAQWAYHMILPWMTFAILFAALYVRMIRANVMETLGEDYVRTARAKGAPEKRVLFSHVLRNALLPVVTMLGMDIAVGLGGAIFTEGVYQLPGLGRTIIISLQAEDLATIQAVVVFATISILVFNLIVDLLYAWVDPRIRLS